MNYKYNNDGSVSVDCSLYIKEQNTCKWASCPLKSYLIDTPNDWNSCKYGILRISWICYIKNKHMFG